MIRTLVFALILAFSAPALAQTSDQARALIEEYQLGDVFTPLEGEPFAVLHAASGLTCRFTGDEPRRRLMTFEGLPRGEDVGCATEQSGRYVTLYATRYAPPITLELALQEGIAGIRDRFADAQPTPALLSMTSEDLPPFLVQHFLITLRDERHITTVMVAEVDGWIIKLRYTAAAADEEALRAAQLDANAVFVTTLLRQQQHGTGTL